MSLAGRTASIAAIHMPTAIHSVVAVAIDEREAKAVAKPTAVRNAVQQSNAFARAGRGASEIQSMDTRAMKRSALPAQAACQAGLAACVIDAVQMRSAPESTRKGSATLLKGAGKEASSKTSRQTTSVIAKQLMVYVVVFVWMAEEMVSPEDGAAAKCSAYIIARNTTTNPAIKR